MSDSGQDMPKTLNWETAQPIVRADPPTLAAPEDLLIPPPTKRTARFPSVPGYEISCELGRGGMGVVYQARDTRLNRVVALKMILAGVAAGAKARQRFEAEATVVARLQHPGVVQIFDVGEYEGRPFFALEFIAGGTLADKLDGTPLPARNAGHLVALLADTTHFLHQNQVLHRDLKPANILLQNLDPGDTDTDRRNNDDKKRSTNVTPGTQSVTPLTGSSPFHLFPKLTDFGLAKLLDSDEENTKSGAILGTPCYMPPEQAEGRLRDYGPPLDIYALGAILYELLTGRPPFRAATALETIRLVIGSEPIPPARLNPAVPRDLETICLKCLQKEPAKRYASAALLSEDLNRYLAGEPIRARPVGWPERVGRLCLRHPLPAGLIVSLVAVTLAGLFAFAVEFRNAKRATAQAELQKGRAEANLRGAVTVVERMLARVTEGSLAFIPQADDTRQELTQDAVKFCDTLLEAETNDPELLRLTGRALGKEGRLLQSLGQAEKAGEAFKRSTDLLRRLVSERPTDADCRHDLAEACCYHGMLYQFEGRLADADGSLQEAVQHATSAVADRAASPEFLDNLAQCYRRLGLIRFQRQQLDDAVSATEASVRHYTRLVRDFPDHFAGQVNAGDAVATLGFILNVSGRSARAIEPLQGAVAQMEALAANATNDKARQRAVEQPLARAWIHLGHAQIQTLRPGNAEELLRRGVAAHQRLVRDYPRFHLHRYMLINGMTAQGVLLLRQNRPTEAEARLREALAVSTKLVEEYPLMGFYAQALQLNWLWLGLALAERGQPAAAEEALTNSCAVAEKLRDGLRISHRSLPYCQALIGRARVRIEQSRPQDALADLECVLAWTTGAERCAAANEVDHRIALWLQNLAQVQAGDVSGLERLRLLAEPERDVDRRRLAEAYAVAARLPNGAAYAKTASAIYRATDAGRAGQTPQSAFLRQVMMR